MNPRGCCCDSPGTDIATARQIYLTLAWVFGAAAAVAAVLNLLF
jgi:hypothetical protein